MNSPSRYRLRFAFAGLVLSAALAFALDPTSLKPEGYVSDFAGVLDPASKVQLEQYCATVQQATGAQIAVVTINSLEGDPIEDFTNRLFEHWGVGKKGKDDGVMLLLSIHDRKSRVELGYGLEPNLPDGFAGSILREMRPSLQEQNYAQALISGTAEIGARVAQAKGVTLDRTLPRRAPATKGGDSGGFPWTIVILLIFLLLVGFGNSGRGGGGLLTGLLLGQILGGSRYRGRDGWGGGGFGGYDGGGGGGGFGGFGGGGSGGGGASGSW